MLDFHGRLSAGILLPALFGFRFVVYFAQQLLDAGSTLDGMIEGEMNFGDGAQLYALAELAAQEGRGALQPVPDFILLLGIAARDDENARVF